MRRTAGPAPEAGRRGAAWNRSALALIAAAGALALGGCNRSDTTDPGSQTTQASTGTAQSRGATGESNQVPPTGTGGPSDRTGARAPTGTEGQIGSSGGLAGSNSTPPPSTGSTSPVAGAVASGLGGTAAAGDNDAAARSAAAGTSAVGAMGTTGSPQDPASRSGTPVPGSDNRVEGPMQSSGRGAADSSATGAPGTAGTLGITANGLPRTADDRRSASGPAANTAATMAAATPGSQQLASADKNFLVAAAASGLFEVNVSQLATSRAASSEVKSYATMLVNHHSQANAELAELAKARGVALPDQLPQDLQAQLRKVSQGSGPQFDKEYLQQVGIKAHQKDIDTFERQGRKVGDPQLKAWVEKHLPSLRQHLEQAQGLERTVAR